MSESLEDKEIRGINFKLLRAFIIATVVIVASIVGSWVSLKATVEKIEIRRAGDDKYIDLRIKSIELNYSSLQIQIDNLRTQVMENTKSLEKIF